MTTRRAGGGVNILPTTRHVDARGGGRRTCADGRVDADRCMHVHPRVSTWARLGPAATFFPLPPLSRPMAGQLPPQIQNQLAQLQELQQQAQVVIQQRQQLELQVRELERTLEELSRLPRDAPLYKSVGSLLVRASDREALERDLADQRETSTVRLESAKRQEARLRERVTALQAELQAALGGR